MTNIEAIIFDMDGCLYPFDRGSGKSFTESEFGQSIKSKEQAFVAEQLGFDALKAAKVCRELKDRFNSHLSLALESEFRIPRQTFFDATWDLNPADYMEPQLQLAPTIGGVSVQAALLTAAPKIWAERVLDFLELQPVFGERKIFGDQDVRKPDPLVFMQAADMLELDPSQIISIGDQELTDIEPAQSIGMMTVKIGGSQSNADFIAVDVIDAIDQLRRNGII